VPQTTLRRNPLFRDFHGKARRALTGGWDILTEIRSHPPTQLMPVILSTADARFIQEHADQIHVLNAIALEKPFLIDELLALVSQVLHGEDTQEDNIP
jgi:DNA-binding response OmpR family regulator